jgi:hypothetical protein
MFYHNTLRYWYFDIIMIIESECSESSEVGLMVVSF